MDLSSRLFPDELHQFGTPRAAPPPGSAKPGNLYADLQSRTLWLGVDASIDPAQAVLVSDIVALTDAIVQSEADANAYTDAQILTRAPTVHTHTASQITDFDQAVGDALTDLPALGFTRGMIMMYSGSLADIGVGALAGWALCDGANGTPDLRDRFVIGAGNKVIGAKNDGTALNTNNGGSHIHTINGTAITASQMPYHSHGGITGYVSHDHQHYVSGYTDTHGGHQHGVSDSAANIGSTGSGRYPAGGYNVVYSAVGGSHNHAINFWSGGISQNHYHSIPAEGGGAAHTHTEGYAGDHYHVIPANTLRDSLPYYALALIMKL